MKKQLTFGDHYNIKKYYNLDEGIAEVRTDLLELPEIQQACYLLEQQRARVAALLQEMVVPDEDLGHRD